LNKVIMMASEFRTEGRRPSQTEIIW
jgi:hypothetical protein